jgi:hypothetical protein
MHFIINKMAMFCTQNMAVLGPIADIGIGLTDRNAGEPSE